MKKNVRLDKITDIAAKRGFFFPTAEIYNGSAGFWTYGHLGAMMKHRWENIWRCFFLGLNDNFFEIEGSNILPRKVFEASGHLESFNDPLIECKSCRFRFRADHFIEDEMNIAVEGLTAEAMDKLVKDNKLKCPKCGSELDNVRMFNMMFPVSVGAVKEEKAYLSPETAQNPYLSFKREFFALREKLPMGLAVIGKAFRNELSPRQGFFRLREFTQAELQIFFDPAKLNESDRWPEIKGAKLRLLLAKDRENEKITEIACEEANKSLKLPKLYLVHMAMVQKFYLEALSIPKERFRFRELSEEERAFYNKIHFDIELNLETLGGFKEIGGVHYRGDYDLSHHQAHSKEKLEVFIDNKRFIPNVLELSFGVDRNIWALMDIFFKEEKERALFNFPKKIAPFDVAVFPLVNKDKLPEKAEQVYESLRQEFAVFFDAKGSIGRMYRRMDEVGCPYMITVDHQALKDGTVTIRNITDMKQIRVKINYLKETIDSLLQDKVEFAKAGKPV